MLDMNFVEFVSLLILSLIAALIVHYAIRYRHLEGSDGFIWKWIVGWIGAWLASPVLGHWGGRVENVYVIPALVGAFIGAFVATAVWKANTKTLVQKTT